jgi:membrane-associated progesterone receptor component
MSEHHHGTTDASAAKGRFEPKEPVQLAAPKSDPISPEYLAKCTGEPTNAPLNAAGC